MVVADLRSACGRSLVGVAEAGSWAGRIGTRLALLVFGILLALVLLEGALRVAGLVSSREGAVAGAGGGTTVVLCIGDSHTWGNGEGIPARLAERLAERSAEYRVINLGVPGTNTAQHRKRFESYLDRFDPSLIVFWGGLNNVWNRTESETWTTEAGAGEVSTWRALVDEIRILRFLRVWRHQSELNEILADGSSYVVPEISGEETPFRKVREQKLSGAGDTFVNLRADDASYLDSELVARATAGDLAWMIERASERGVPVLPITYPHETSHYRDVNLGIRWAARDTKVPVVVGSEARARLVRRRRVEGGKPPGLFDRTAHPTQALYDEIADLALEKIDENDLLPKRGSGAPSVR